MLIIPVPPADFHLHMLMSSCGPFGVIPDGVCNFVSGASDAASQALEVIQNPFKWLYHHTLGAPIPQHAGEAGWDACQADWSQPACPKLIDELKPENVTLAESWPRLYGAFAVSGVFIAMTCCVARVVRAVFDERSAAMQMVVDNVIRMVVATGLLIAPSPDNSLLLNVIRLSTNASGRIAEAAGGAVASAFTANLDLGAVVGNIAATGFGLAGIGDFLVAIPIMHAVGGRYLELGAEALNPLAVAVGTSPDAAAGLVLPVLSVMAGDDRGVRDGRPIRRLPDEDQGWLHGELVEFFAARDAAAPPALMRDAVHHLEARAMARVLTERERDRCRVITARLRRFTQGRRAAVFDRPSTFTVDERPVAIGLKSFAMTYGADLTPALAVLLTAILDALERRRSRMIVVVDEAHRVTSDPDAGEVLGQLVRQARKHGAGVWMLSQRVEDFVRTDLGRTLAATSSSKLVLGTEEAVVDDVREVFRLSDEEVAAICPSSCGRGVLLAGAERAVVSVLPGPAIMALADTRPTPAARTARPERVW